MWFSLRSPELAEDFERLMTGDRDYVRGSLDTVSEWRLTRPLDLPGQSIEAADYVLIAEIVEIQRWQEQATELVQHLIGLGGGVLEPKLVLEPVAAAGHDPDPQERAGLALPLGDHQHARAFPYGNRQGDDEQGDAVPASS